MPIKEIQPHDLVGIYHNARHSRINSWVFSILATGSAIAGFAFFISDLPVRLQLAVASWSSSLILVNRSAVASRDADKFSRRVAALEQFSEESFIHSLAQSVRPSLEPIALSAQLETTGSPEADAVLQCLSDYDIESRFEKAIKGPSFTRLFLKPARGQKVNQIMTLGAELQLALGLDNPPLISIKPSGLAVDIPNAQRSILKFSQFIQFEQRSPLEPLLLAVGVDLDGRLIELDLSDPNTCHVLGGGTTGSGKSEFLRTAVLSLIGRYSPEAVKIAIADPKRVTFNDFENSAWMYDSIAKSPLEIASLLSRLTTEMDNRYELLEKAGVADLASYNQQTTQTLPRIVTLIDEYGECLDQADKEQVDSIEKSVRRLAQKARAAGIHILLFTQRPDAKKLDPQLRSNLPASIGLKVQRLEESQIIMGTPNSGAENLLGKGDLLLRAGNDIVRLQAPLVDSPVLVKTAITRCQSSPLPPGDAPTLQQFSEEFKVSDPRKQLEACFNLPTVDEPAIAENISKPSVEIENETLKSLAQYIKKKGNIAVRDVKYSWGSNRNLKAQEVEDLLIELINLKLIETYTPDGSRAEWVIWVG